MLETIRLTHIDFRRSKSYWSNYVGKLDFSRCQNNIEIDANLGCVNFPVLRTRGSVTALAGTGIKIDQILEAGGGIKSDWGIQAGGRIQSGKGIETGGAIKAGDDISAAWAIISGESIEASKNLSAGTNIKAGDGIAAGGSITAGAGLKAGWNIKSGSDIIVGEGIEAGLSIECRGTLSVKLRAFAGLCLWRQPVETETRIECHKFEGGTVAYGTLLERNFQK